MSDQIIRLLANSIRLTLTNERYWKSERAFQSEFYCILKEQCGVKNLFPKDAIFETEYQKRLDLHNLRRRPDLIVHIPTEMTNADVRENNYLVVQFKVKATLRKAIADFKKINELIAKLNYPMGVFINVDSEGKAFLGTYSKGEYKEKIHELSVYIKYEEIVIRHDYYSNGNIVSRVITNT